MIHRYPSAKYKEFEARANKGCEGIEWPFEDKPLHVELSIHVHNPRFDLDNAAKPTIDALQKVFGFNDNKIYSLDLRKYLILKSVEEFTNVYIRAIDA